MSNVDHPSRLRVAVVALVLAGSFGFAATSRPASGDHYHTNCVGHGFVHGGDSNDRSFFSRVETGCSSTYRRCEIYSNYSWRGSEITPDGGTTCNAWSQNFGSYVECDSYAKVYNQSVFAEHNHLAHNWCN